MIHERMETWKGILIALRSVLVETREEFRGIQSGMEETEKELNQELAQIREELGGRVNGFVEEYNRTIK